MFFRFLPPDIAIDMSYDKYSCIGGQGWYWVRLKFKGCNEQERCSSNFFVNVTRNIFSDTPPVAAPFREDVPITLGDVQSIHLTPAKRKECMHYKYLSNRSRL